jgi:antitoxin component of RelBE/YafQ-DinJ toxin-antitoxin module
MSAAKSTSRAKTVARSAAPGQLLFRYRGADTIAGVSRKTATRLAKTLGLTETQAIHLALARLAQETLPRYEADNAPLTEKQLKAIKRLEPQGRLVTSEHLFA